MKQHIDECVLARKAIKYVDDYLDMGCFKDPKLVRGAMLEGFEFGFREAEKYYEKKYHLFGQEPNQTYCESCANFPCEATKNAMFCEGKNWREK